MKKILHCTLALGAAMLMVSCAGHEDYDAYVAMLKEQPAAIDTIASPAGYAAYLDSLSAKATNFDQLGVKLNPDQKDELATLSMEIQKALDAKYATLKTTIEAADSTGNIVVLDASAPAEPFTPNREETTLE